jgi:hypothetical protein
MKKTVKRQSAPKSNPASSKSAEGNVTTPERLTKDDLKALRTNLKAGRSIPARCCEYAPQ